MSLDRPRVLAEVRFTKESIRTLTDNFANYQKDGVVVVEVTERGLWLRHPDMELRRLLGRSEGT